MKRHMIYLILVIGFGVSGCSGAASEISVSLREDSTTYEYESLEPFPFDVKIDKPSLELEKVDETRVFIFTELTEWSYTVQAEYGKISEKKVDSFVYTKPKDKDQKEDIITLDLIDGENNVHYKLVIPLSYIFDPEHIINQ